MTRDEMTQLGRYNAERRRGLMHTNQWHDEMADLQRRYNAQLRAEHAHQVEAAALAALVPWWRRWTVRAR